MYAMVSVDQKIKKCWLNYRLLFFSVKEEQGKEKKTIQDIILFTFSIAYEIIVQVLNKKDWP